MNKYKLNNDEKLILDIILSLVNYDLKKNFVDLNINSEYFIKFHNKEIINFKNNEEEEKIKTTLNYYKYLLEKKNYIKFIEIYNHIIKNRPWFFSNTFLSVFFESFNNKEISILFYINLVFKTMINPSYYRKSIYDETSEDIKYIDSWHNSTNVLQNQFNIINQFIVFNELDINIKEKNNIVFSNLFKFNEYLIRKNFVKEKIIKYKNKNKYKTIKFWSLIEETDLQDLIYDTNFSTIPYKLIEKNNIFYEKGCHFSKIVNIFRENWYSGEIFHLKEKEYINKMLNLKLYINKSFLKKILKKFENNYNIKIDEIEKIIKEDSIMLKKIFNKEILDEKDIENIKNLQKKINKNIDLLRIKKLSNLKNIDYLYLPIFFDFRGRNYFDDYISPTFSKLTRLSFYYGYYTKEEIESVNIDLIKPYINNYIENKIDLVIKKYKLKKKKYIINTVFWILISIGKHLISKEKIKIPIEDFIEEGFKYLFEYKIKLNLKEEIEVEHYIDILESLKKNKIKKKIILKDATASVIQNLIKILGPKNQESLNLSNLGDPYNWYDPYSFILDKFKKCYKNEEEKIKYFTRKTIKKTIMTTPYSAGLKTCWKYFKKEVISNFDLKDKEVDDLYIIYESFYNFVLDFFEEMHLFRNPSKKIIEYFKNIAEKEKKIILYSEDSKINLIYFKQKIHYIDIINEEGFRITKKIKKINTNEIDYKKIYNSIRANIAHWLDAIFLRKLVNSLKNPIFTIHDEFAIDFLNVNSLIISANLIANEELLIKLPWDYSNNLKTFSIFILL